jgi:hypothetical protein
MSSRIIMSKLEEDKYASSGTSEEDTASVRIASSLDEEHLNEGGAAVEEHSPLGQQIGWFSVICLNISQMVSATAKVANGRLVPASFQPRVFSSVP